jgi:uncharacterized membrane protein
MVDRQATRAVDPEVSTMTVEPLPTPLPARLAERLEGDKRLDPVRGAVDALAARVLPRGRLLDELRGRSTGHALHPILTDLPLGVWTGAVLLDLTGPRAHAAASRRLVGAGVLLAVPTALTGLADWSGLDAPESRRDGVVHALVNVVGNLTFASSWLLRRRGHLGAGVLTGLAGGAVVTVGGYLGGHLTLRRGEPGASRGPAL